MRLPSIMVSVRRHVMASARLTSLTRGCAGFTKMKKPIENRQILVLSPGLDLATS